MIVSQAYTVQKALCSGEPVEREEYSSFLGKFNPEKVEFKMHDEYSMIVSRAPEPGVADTVWVAPDENVIIIKGDMDWKVELRIYRSKLFFEEAVKRIKELNGVN